MTVSKLIKILKQAEKNGQGNEEITIELKKKGFKYELEFDMYHCEREPKHHHYNIHAKNF